MDIHEVERLFDSKFQDTNRRLDEIKDTVKKLDGKMDTTCERLTIQETNYKNHIEQEKSEREIHDKNLDKKYQVWNLISSFGLFILGVIEFKRGF